MAQMSGSDDAGDRTGRYFHEAVRADDPSVRQHDGRTRGDPESHVPGIRHGQHGPGRQRIDDSGIGIVLHLHEPAGTSGGVYPGLRIHDAVGRIHRPGARGAS